MMIEGSTSGAFSDSNADSSESISMAAGRLALEGASTALPEGTVAVSCAVCKKAHRGCDGLRPCSRCARLGMADLCVDIPLKKRGRPRKDNVGGNDLEADNNQSATPPPRSPRVDADPQPLPPIAKRARVSKPPAITEDAKSTKPKPSRSQLGSARNAHPMSRPPSSPQSSTPLVAGPPAYHATHLGLRGEEVVDAHLRESYQPMYDSLDSHLQQQQQQHTQSTQQPHYQTQAPMSWQTSFANQQTPSSAFSANHMHDSPLWTLSSASAIPMDQYAAAAFYYNNNSPAPGSTAPPSGLGFLTHSTSFEDSLPYSSFADANLNNYFASKPATTLTTLSGYVETMGMMDPKFIAAEFEDEEDIFPKEEAVESPLPPPVVTIADLSQSSLNGNDNDNNNTNNGNIGDGLGGDSNVLNLPPPPLSRSGSHSLKRHALTRHALDEHSAFFGDMPPKRHLGGLHSHNTHSASTLATLSATSIAELDDLDNFGNVLGVFVTGADGQRSYVVEKPGVQMATNLLDVEDLDTDVLIRDVVVPDQPVRASLCTWNRGNVQRHPMYADISSVSSKILETMSSMGLERCRNPLDDDTETLAGLRFHLKGLWDSFNASSMSPVVLRKYEPVVRATANTLNAAQFADQCCFIWDPKNVICYVSNPFKNLIGLSDTDPFDEYIVYNLMAPAQVPIIMLIQSGAELNKVSYYETSWMIRSKLHGIDHCCRGQVTLCRNDNGDHLYTVAIVSPKAAVWI